jgi:hypothetical protein
MASIADARPIKLRKILQFGYLAFSYDDYGLVFRHRLLALITGRNAQFGFHHSAISSICLYLSAAAALVFLAGTAGTGVVSADVFACGNRDSLGLSRSWSSGGFFLGESDLIYGMDDIVLDAGDEAFKHGVALFFVDHNGLDLPHGVKPGLLSEVVHGG